MDVFLQQFQHLKIQLEDITSATNNFDDKNNCIGVGGFGKVYKGELSHSKGRSMVAIKRLNPKYGQGIPEFLKEITTLSHYRHENLISLLGFCCQQNEMILVYEYASRGSLDRHLNSPHLTWSQRIKICLDAAKGLSYLHDPMETHQRLIHCDVKSANILLDDQWNGKVADFGLSIMGPANEQNSVIVTLAAGTLGYLDPQYEMTHTLTKESDVYSFGVVLFEVLCGTSCCTYRHGRVQQNFLPMWIESYKENKLNDIIFKIPTLQPLDQSALETLSDIVYQCLKTSREERPKMAEVVTELKTTLKSQEFFESREFNEWKAQVFYYEEIIKTAEPPLNYTNTSMVELWKLLSKGVLLNGSKTWFSLNKKGEHCEMISFAKCLVSVPNEFDGWSSAYNSRFAVGTFPYTNGRVETCVKPQFLSPGIIYTINLVFKFSSEEKVRRYESEHIELTYKLQGDTETSISYLAYEREDGWWMCELYQFISAERTVDLKILFHGFHASYAVIQVEGIEFRPLEEEKHKDEKQPISNSDANWEEKLPCNYENIMKYWSKDSMQWTTKKEAFSILRKGFLVKDGKALFSGRPTRLVNYDKMTCMWFFLDENGKKCHLLSASVGFGWLNWAEMISLPESRFGSALQCNFQMLVINTGINQFPLVSSETTYARYLVYKLPEDQSEFEAPVKVKDMRSNLSWYIYLVSPQSPFIRLNVDQNNHKCPINGPKMKDLPQQRNDGWMEVQIGVFRTAGTIGNVSTSLKLTTCGKNFKGLIIEGVECRPI